MFEYYKGYEIDGSDTSYSLLTPDFEKMKEMLKFFFSLKVIDKNKDIKICYVSKSSQNKYTKDKVNIKELVDKKYNRSNLDELFDDIIKYNVGYIEIRYNYVQIESLFPEVKREIIDYIVLANKNNMKLEYNNPVLTVINPYYDNSIYKSTVDNINITFNVEPDDCFDDITPDDYIELCSKDSNCSIGFDVSVVHGGVSPILPYYIMEKMARRFPEYKLNPYKDYDDINCCGKIDVDWTINECFEISPKNFTKIFKNQEFSFIERINYKDVKYIEEGKVYLHNVESNKYKFNKVMLKKCEEKDEVFEENYGYGKQIYSKEFAIYSILKRYKKDESEYITLDDYISFCQEIVEKIQLNHNEVKAYTVVYLNIFYENDKTKYYSCKVRFNTENSKGIFELIVPRKSWTLVNKLLSK